MNIAYACNDGYVMQTGISLISLFENNSHFGEIKVFIISSGISQSNLDILKSICDDYNRKMVVIKFKDIAYDLCISSIGRHIETIYAKVFFERIGEVDKIIYLDSDTIVADKLDDMWNINLEDFFMGMVQTTSGTDAKKMLGIPKETPFFNDGMAVVNVNYCRDHHLIEKSLKVIKEFKGNPPVLSEGCINKVCQGHIYKMSPRFNMMSGIYQLLKSDLKYAREILDYDIEDLRDSMEKPVIIHFLAGFYNRPWNKWCTHPLRFEFYKYKAMSPWKDDPLIDAKLPLRLRIIGIFVDCFGPKVSSRLRNCYKRIVSVLN